MYVFTPNKQELFSISENKNSDNFKLIHCDLWGSYRTLSYSSAHYFLMIVDDYLRNVWMYLLNNKTETSTHIKKIVVMSERQFQKQIKTARSDNGMKFLCMIGFFLGK